MPVPKKTETVTETETVEPDVVETPAPAELVYSQEPHDFEVRRAALELAISAREPEPVLAAPDYYAFLSGKEKAAEGTA